MKLVKIYKDEYCFNSRKIRKFYNGNKDAIDKIKKYSYISNFMIPSYVWNEKYHKEMYNYILTNRGELD